jgi:hypothetical protein
VFANAPTANYSDSFVYFDPVQPNSKTAATVLQTAIGPHTRIAPLPSTIAPLAQQASNPMTVVVVGTDFGGQLANPQEHVQKAPPHVPPYVRTDPGSTLSVLQQSRKPPFPVLLPHVLERTSRLSTLEPLRLFKPAPFKHELALTSVTGAGNVYWQIIETDWTTAPILRHKTGVYRIGGRRYELFTSGGHIHMVVLRRGGATYWVVNTLRDEMSNETMLAIAKGLAPLGK